MVRVVDRGPNQLHAIGLQLLSSTLRRLAAAAHDTRCHQSSDKGEDPNTTHDQERPPAVDECLPAVGIQLSLPSSAQVCGAIALCR